MSCNFGCYYCACIACVATLVGPAISVEVVTTFALQIFAVPRCAIEIGAHFSSGSSEYASTAGRATGLLSCMQLLRGCGGLE